MTVGEITAEREAVITIRLRDAESTEVEIVAIVDTDFSDALTLPAVLIAELKRRRRDATQIRLADGSLHQVDVFEGHIFWQSEWRRIPIQASESAPLLGMSLLFGNLLCLELADGGSVTIEALE